MNHIVFGPDPGQAFLARPLRISLPRTEEVAQKLPRTEECRRTEKIVPESSRTEELPRSFPERRKIVQNGGIAQKLGRRELSAGGF